MARAWYVVHTYASFERKVKENLMQRVETMAMEDKIFDVLVPTQEVTEVRGNQKKKVNKRIFPGYVLVEMNLDDDSWYVVRNTPGVTGFVGLGNKPTPLDEREVQYIKSQMGIGPQRFKEEIQYSLGNMVNIIDGPFIETTGQICEINEEKRKVKVLVNIFNRETAIELNFDQIELA